MAAGSAAGCSGTYDASTHRTPATTGPTVSTTPAPSAKATRATAKALARPGSAAAQLTTLRVGRGPMTGYDRDRFGQAWLDADRNGCDTRNDMLCAAT